MKFVAHPKWRARSSLSIAAGTESSMSGRVRGAGNVRDGAWEARHVWCGLGVGARASEWTKKIGWMSALSPFQAQAVRPASWTRLGFQLIPGPHQDFSQLQPAKVPAPRILPEYRAGI
jgi:hypothetical protein